MSYTGCCNHTAIAAEQNFIQYWLSTSECKVSYDAFKNKCILPFITFFCGSNFFKIFATRFTISSLLSPVFLVLNFFNSSFVVIGLCVNNRKTASSVIPGCELSLPGEPEVSFSYDSFCRFNEISTFSVMALLFPRIFPLVSEGFWLWDSDFLAVSLLFNLLVTPKWKCSIFEHFKHQIDGKFFLATDQQSVHHVVVGFFESYILLHALATLNSYQQRCCFIETYQN